jgi:hypothetical protein
MGPAKAFLSMMTGFGHILAIPRRKGHDPAARGGRQLSGWVFLLLGVLAVLGLSGPALAQPPDLDWAFNVGGRL